MIEDRFPDFYRRADKHSNRWQGRYLWSEKTQLASLFAAAAVAAIGLDALLIVVLFAVAVAAQILRLTLRADEKWWNGRAGAESAKTASWLYVVGGTPFQLNNSSADVELARRLTEIAAQVAKLVPVPTGEAHVTPEMRAMRARPLTDRIAAYQQERIRHQRDWYATKSQFNSARATWWSVGAITAQSGGLTFGIVAAVNDWPLDAVGLFSALGAAVVAWVAVKQYEVLARSYAVASAELGTIDVQIGGRNWDEDDWAAFVPEAEAAISREHTSWRASRAV